MTPRNGPDWASIVAEFPDLPDAPAQIAPPGTPQNGETVFTDGITRYSFGSGPALPSAADAWAFLEGLAAQGLPYPPPWQPFDASCVGAPPQLGDFALPSTAWPEPDTGIWYTAAWFDPATQRLTPIYTDDPDEPFARWHKGVPG